MNSVQQHIRLVFADNILFNEKIISSPIRLVPEQCIAGLRIENKRLFLIIE